MRIAWFVHRYAPCLGGAEQFSREMVRRLVAAGHAVDVFTTNADDLWYFTDRSRQPIGRPGVEVIDGALVHRFAVRHRPFQRYVGKVLSRVPLWSIQCRHDSFMPLLPGLDRVRGPYDLVVGTAFPYTILAHAAWLTARAAATRLVMIPFLHVSTMNDRVYRSYTRPHQMQLLREADHVFAATRLEARVMAAHGVAEHRLSVLGMGFDAVSVTGGDRIRQRAIWGVGESTKVIGHLATLSVNKGTLDLVRAVARVNQRRAGDDRVVLVLAGKRSPEFEEFWSELPPEERTAVLVTGRIEDRSADFFAGIDLFAMPSRTDSYGIVFLEAWANGRPVIAARAGGVAEVVEDEQRGLLVPFGDVAAISFGIERLVGEESLARRLGEAGLAHVAHGFSWDDRFSQFWDRIGASMDRTEPHFAARRWSAPRHRSLAEVWRSNPGGPMRSTAPSVR